MRLLRPGAATALRDRPGRDPALVTSVAAGGSSVILRRAAEASSTRGRGRARDASSRPAPSRPSGFRFKAGGRLGVFGASHLRGTLQLSPGADLAAGGAGQRLRRRAVPAPGGREAATGCRSPPLGARLGVERDRRARRGRAHSSPSTTPGRGLLPSQAAPAGRGGPGYRLRRPDRAHRAGRPRWVSRSWPACARSLFGQTARVRDAVSLIPTLDRTPLLPPERARRWRGRRAGRWWCTRSVTELEETRAALEASLREVSQLKERLEAENVVLQQQVRSAHGFDEIVGTSAVLAGAGPVEQVATTDAPVLAPRRDRHRQGPRRRAPAPALAAPRAAVRHRELRRPARDPGRERAVRPREGRLHRAPSSAPPGASRSPTAARCSSTRSASCRSRSRPSCCASCRAGEFERLGATQTISVDVRMIAATNRDLEARCARAASATTCTTASTSALSPCPRSASAARTSARPAWQLIHRRQAAARPLGRARARAPDAALSPPTPGRATCASSRTWSSGADLDGATNVAAAPRVHSKPLRWCLRSAREPSLAEPSAPHLRRTRRAPARRSRSRTTPPNALGLIRSSFVPQ